MRYLALLVVSLLVAPVAAGAEVTRYAVVVGHDEGEPGEPRLRYAEEDARRVAEVLTQLGGVRPENLHLVRGADAELVRAALIRLNDVIRTRGAPALLVVFYSGHADAEALHLGGSRLPLEQLESLVRGSAASLRLLVVDACRSGALTRVKGGTQMPAAAVELAERLPADGVVFWTSSAANEDAQESDELRGSFFTHHLVSGLMGAADVDGDGAVTLGEAYAHAYEATLRATSRTWAGAQHATFRHETHGMVDVTLTTLAVGGRALLTVPRGREYLVLAGGSDGPVVAEVGARDAERRVSLPPGRYFVRGRARDHLLEGYVGLRAGERRALDESALDRVAYARLVRKGGGDGRADRVELGYTLRSPPASGARVCQGVVVGWAVDLPVLSMGARASACRGGFENPYLEATTDEVGLEARVVHAWDVRKVTIAGGAVAGAGLLRQELDSRGGGGEEMGRTSVTAHVGVTAGVSVELSRGLYGAVELDALTAFYRQQGMDEEAGATAGFAVRGSVLVGKRW